MLLFSLPGIATAQQPVDGRLASRPSTDNVSSLTLSSPAQRLYPGTWDAVLAYSKSAGELQLIDSADAKILARRPLPGSPIYLVTYVIRAGGWFDCLMVIEDSSVPDARTFVLAELEIKQRNFQAWFQKKGFFPAEFRLPAVRYAPSMKDIKIIAWDRMLPSSTSSYTLGDARDRRDVPVKRSPFDLVGLGPEGRMLAVSPALGESGGYASVVDVEKGDPLDIVPVKGGALDFKDQNSFAVFTPSPATAGPESIVTVNSESKLVTILSAGSDRLHVDTPLQSRLVESATFRAGHGPLRIAANADLSLILIGSVGSDELAVYRKLGGGLEQLPLLKLAAPISDMTFLPRNPANGLQSLAILSEGGSELRVVPAVTSSQSLYAINSVNEPPPEYSQGFPNSTLTASEIPALQRTLSALNYNIGPIDGIAGPATVSAIRAFQFSNDLKVTGASIKGQSLILDEDTLKSLNQAIMKIDDKQRGLLFQNQLPAN